MIIPIFLPQQGCPKRCIYCNQEGLTGQYGLPKRQEINATVEMYLDSQKQSLKSVFEQNSVICHEIAFYGGSFTCLPVAVQNDLLFTARHWLQRGVIQGIRLSTRPDGINEQTVERLRTFGVTTVEVGAQSMNPQVLRRINRGHRPGDTVRALWLLRKTGFQTIIHLMTGLPGDDENSCLMSLQECIWLKPHYLRIHPTLVLKNSELERQWRSGEYQAWSWGRTLRLLTQMAALCAKSGIKVVRWGLMPGELCSENYLAGPYSSSLGEWVRRSLALYYALALSNAVLNKQWGASDQKSWQLIVPHQDISLVTGENQWLLRHLNAFCQIQVSHWSANPLAHELTSKDYLPFHGSWYLGVGDRIIFNVTQEEFIANWRI